MSRGGIGRKDGRGRGNGQALGAVDGRVIIDCSR